MTIFFYIYNSQLDVPEKFYTSNGFVIYLDW